MGRVPRGIRGETKKGPWSPEEDLLLSSYIQENGPGNWKSVSINTGLNRCDKSCRLRWTNYLRPGIKHGTFTSEEERMIIQLHDVLGNKWAGMAHFIPGRTGNDIKNYWNSHLKKKVDRGRASGSSSGASSSFNTTSNAPDEDSDSSKRCWERRLQANVHLARKALSDALSLPPQAPTHDHNVIFPSPPVSNPNSNDTLPPTAPGLGSPLPVASAPLLPSRFMSFNPPGWNQYTSQQQPMIPADNHQFPSQGAGQITQAVNNSTTEMHIFNCENVALWLRRWNKETPNLRLDNDSARHPSLPPAAVPVVSGRQHEDSLSPAIATSVFPSWQN